MKLRAIVSTSAAARVRAATQFIQRQTPAREVLIVGASRGAADDLARAVATPLGATFGLSRFSLTELAARLAFLRVAGARRTIGTQAGAEAIAARAVFDASAAHDLTYFAPVASTRGFPRALARTLHEVRLARVEADRLLQNGEPSADLARLLARVEAELETQSVDDRRTLFDLAREACEEGRARWTGVPLVLLDVSADSKSESALLTALIARAPETLATVPAGDDRTRAVLEASGASIEEPADLAEAGSDLAHLRQYVFTNEAPPLRESSGDVRMFSAPGEGREAVEIVRRVLAESARGVPFDQMAVFLRAPQQYLGLLDHACDRAGIPVYFDRGTRRPDPSGRAFLALLSCAVEGLSAKRFDEYLSIGQVPRLWGKTPLEPVPPRDEVFSELSQDAGGDDEEAVLTSSLPVDSDEEAIVAGTLRSPWKWEELIVESSVVGGRNRQDGRARWRRRLDGLAADYRFRLDALGREEPDSPRIVGLQRDLRNLTHLRSFALPIVDLLAEWPEQATWGDWLARFGGLAERALDRPNRVLRVLADLRPMADVGPVTLEEARDVLDDRLVTLEWDPPPRRYGRLFVGTPFQARGRIFRTVFVPGLAERIVPQRPREDPLLVDERRKQIDPALIHQDDRGSTERLLLKIAIGAATERVYFSYPRMDIAETRARVPSFYALDVMRAITGRVPDHRALAKEAEEEAGAMLAWPAPRDPDDAIDDLEHDLAVLRRLMESRDPLSVKGRGHYLLALNEALKRSVIRQWARGRSAWSTSDGLIRIAPGTREALASQRLGRRPYSLSALQRFAACPYQFLLSTIHRLEPWEEPEPLLRMDPLTRGSLFHRVQAEFYRAITDRGEWPITAESIPAAATVLEGVVDRVAGEYEELLAPAIDRVWRDEIAELRRDLGIWVHKLVDAAPWIPEYFEFSFGLGAVNVTQGDHPAGGAFGIAEGRDPRSRPDPVLIDGRFLLRGSVDLIERRADLDVLRITDHKTGRNRSNRDLIVGGGGTLQPVLYGVAAEAALGKKVIAGRLFYCTTAGEFASHEIPLNDYTRGQALEVLAIIDRAVEQGSLVAAPAERACVWCDFRPVCGSREEERVAEKAKERLADLDVLRSMR